MRKKKGGVGGETPSERRIPQPRHMLNSLTAPYFTFHRSRWRDGDVTFSRGDARRRRTWRAVDQVRKLPGQLGDCSVFFPMFGLCMFRHDSKPSDGRCTFSISATRTTDVSAVCS